MNAASRVGGMPWTSQTTAQKTAVGASAAVVMSGATQGNHYLLLPPSTHPPRTPPVVLAVRETLVGHPRGEQCWGTVVLAQKVDPQGEGLFAVVALCAPGEVRTVPSAVVSQVVVVVSSLAMAPALPQTQMPLLARVAGTPPGAAPRQTSPSGPPRARA